MKKEHQVLLYDTTLRDGLQENGREISISNAKIFARKLDEMGFAWLEAGFASASQEQLARIKALVALNLENTKVTAFGRTRGKNEKVEAARDLNAIMESGAKTATIVGKARKRDVIVSLQTEPEDNLAMIEESIKYMKSKGLEVIFDAEHFFDGTKDDQAYTLKTLETALEAGADWIVLCDTNGASTEQFIVKGIKLAASKIPLVKIGFHGHNDRGRAIANSEVAYRLGVRHIQGTINGYGERCGNTDLCQLIPNLYFDYNCIGIKQDKLVELTSLSEMTAEFLNAHHRSNQPWVGSLAGYTEAGMHTSGMLRDPGSYIHADLSLVGNKVSFGLSGNSGKSNIAIKAKELGFDLTTDEINKVATLHDQMVKDGYVFAGADASFFLLILKALERDNERIFENDSWQVVASCKKGKLKTTATIYATNTTLGNKKISETALGDGPVDAFYHAAAKITKKLFPDLPSQKLIDYRVKIVNSTASSAAKVRVIIESGNKSGTWTTVGVHENIIEASWLALRQSIDYSLYKWVND